jgi:hypothetical protein
MYEKDLIRRVCNADWPKNPYRELITLQDCLELYRSSQGVDLEEKEKAAL